MQTKKYVPPAKQQQQQHKKWQPEQKTNIQLKKQSELNMKYSSNDFPELNSKSKTQIERIPFSFADVNEKYKTNQQKKEEAEKEKENSINKLTPGWMYIRRNIDDIDNKHKIEYKYGPESEHYTASLIQREKDEKKQSDIYFRKLVEWWQWDRDEQNRLLGDCSPYWGTATLMEMYDVDTADDKESYRKRWNQKTFVNESAALESAALDEPAALEPAALEPASNNIEYDSIKYNV